VFRFVSLFWETVGETERKLRCRYVTSLPRLYWTGVSLGYQPRVYV